MLMALLHVTYDIFFVFSDSFFCMSEFHFSHHRRSAYVHRKCLNDIRFIVEMSLLLYQMRDTTQAIQPNPHSSEHQDEYD